MASLFVKMSHKIGTVYFNPVDSVNVTHEPTAVTDNEWVREQLALGHIVECDLPAAPAAEETEPPVE
jgi:hypothetical protein